MKVADPIKRTANPLDRFNCGRVMFSGGRPRGMKPTLRNTHDERKMTWRRSQFMVSVASVGP